MATKRPSGIADDAWARLKNKASKFSAGAGTIGEERKRYHQALAFYVQRWKGNLATPPKGLKLPKRYPDPRPFRFISTLEYSRSLRKKGEKRRKKKNG